MEIFDSSLLRPVIAREEGLEPGTQVGHYVIERLIAIGGSAMVYQARDPRACRNVAIKLLHPGPESDRERSRRLLHEARAYTRLIHPRIVTLFEVGQYEGSPFLVMEWVTGTTLADRLAKGPLDEHECLKIMEQVADGLSAAHAVGLAHRDIKPANIMLTPEGNAKLLDFGLAKQVAPDQIFPKSWVTSDGAILGTPAYMSPEQVQGGELTVATDVFAFGAVLYEMLCGAPAFRRESTIDTLNAVSLVQARPLPRCRSRVGKGLAGLAMDCLQITPADRPRDARDLVVELANLTHRRKGSTNGRYWLPAVAGTLGIILATLIWWIIPGATTGGLSPARGAHMLPADGQMPVITSDGSAVVYCSTDNRELWLAPTGTSNPEMVWAGKHRITGLSLTPDDRYVLFAAAEGFGPSWVWEVSIDGGVPRKITRGYAPTVSPDGAMIAALQELTGHFHQLIVCRRDGTERRVLTSFEDLATPLSCAFSFSGETIITLLTDGVRWSRLVAVNVVTGTPELIAKVRGVPVNGLALSKKLNVALWCLRPPGSGQTMLCGTALEGGTTRIVFPGPGLASYPSITSDGTSLVLDIGLRESELVEVPVNPKSPSPSSSIRVLSGTRGGSQPRVSPDGTRMVFQSARGDLWILERETNSLGPLLTTGEASFNPAWSPDGRFVGYSCIKNDRSALWLAGADGSDPRRITEGDWNSFHPVWHPSGRSMIFISDRDGTEDLFRIDIETGEMVRLGFDGAVNPAISPDGHIIAFAIPGAVDDARLRVVRLTDDQESIETLWEEPIVINRWAGGKPRFSPDGRWIAYDQPSGPAGADIWVLPVDRKEGTEPRRLTAFEIPASLVSWFDWAPDGKLVVSLARDPERFLLLKHADRWIGQAMQ
jgi:Tol biopolymer transport system component/tRNA A-37 threonylcarbamoyl transferase component Bud32